MSHKQFFVPGIPAGKGSMKAFVVAGKARLTHNSAKTKPWQSQVSAFACRAWNRAPLARGVAVAVECIFVSVRPKGHYGTGRNSGRLKESAPLLPAFQPDGDKLLRTVLDALTGVCFVDDGQVTTAITHKVYGECPGVDVTVSEAGA